jgi:hypothetical protein
MRTITGATTVQLLLVAGDRGRAVDDAQDWVLPAVAGERQAPIAVHDTDAGGTAATDRLPLRGTHATTAAGGRRAAGCTASHSQRRRSSAMSRP